MRSAATDVTLSPVCRPARPDRRRRRSFRLDERRSGFDRRRSVCRSPLTAALEAPVLRLRDDRALLAELLVMVNVLSALDLFITFTVLRLGAVELNPLMARLFESGLLPAALVKLGLVLAATGGLWLLRRRRSALRTSLLLLGAYGSLVALELAGLLRTAF